MNALSSRASTRWSIRVSVLAGGHHLRRVDMIDSRNPFGPVLCPACFGTGTDRGIPNAHPHPGYCELCGDTGLVSRQRRRKFLAQPNYGTLHEGLSEEQDDDEEVQ